MPNGNFQKRTKVSKDEFLDAVPGSRGQLAPIEEKLHCTRGALRELMKQNPELQIELEDEIRRSVDKVIVAMFDDAESGDSRRSDKARELLLKALARDRGFGEKLEVTGANGAPLVFLHSSAKLLPVDDWAKKAAAFSESQEKIIDAQFEELGLENPTDGNGTTAPAQLPAADDSEGDS